MEKKILHGKYCKFGPMKRLPRRGESPFLDVFTMDADVTLSDIV